MPPRIPSSAAARPSSAIAIFRAAADSQSCTASSGWSPLQQQSAGFSSTASLDYFSKNRREFRRWMKLEGKNYKTPAGYGKPRYLTLNTERLKNGGFFASQQPFHLNPHFIVKPVLNDKSRELVWHKVMQDGESIKAVSAEYGIDIRRVAAIVRLKEVEKDWEKQGKALARPYREAVHGMVGTHNITPFVRNEPYEDIHEVHIHPDTRHQIFWPTSESKHFTREDAAKVFNDKLLPIDKRVQIPELIQLEKDMMSGKSPYDAAQTFKAAAKQSELDIAEKARVAAAEAEKSITHVHTSRFDMRFQNYNAEEVGKRGRGRNAVGARYGVPHYDRVKGQVKIPTSVP